MGIRVSPTRYLLEEISESMPLSKEIRSEVAREVREQLSAAVEGLKPKGLSRVSHFIREVGSVAAVLGIILALLAIVVVLGVDVASRRDPNARFQKGMEDFQTQTNGPLDKIETYLAGLQAPATLRTLSSMSPSEFAASLKILEKVSKFSPQDINVSLEIIRSVTEKLRSVPEVSPNYWPTVLQFVQFASSVLTPPTDVPPPGIPNVIASANECHPRPGRHCMVASQKRIVLDGGSIPNPVFDHCRIIFTENAVDLRGTVFNDCVFEMPVISPPSPYLKRAARILIASDLTSVSIPFL